MDQMNGFRVAQHFEKGKLLLAINSIAALSIFFFGYDQGIPIDHPSHRQMANSL